MTTHDGLRTLVAASMGPDVDPVDAAQASSHLEVCHACRTLRLRLGDDEHRLRTIAVAGTQPRVWDAIHAELQGRPPRRRMPLAWAALLVLGVSLIGVVVVAGLRDRADGLPEGAWRPSDVTVDGTTKLFLRDGPDGLVIVRSRELCTSDDSATWRCRPLGTAMIAVTAVRHGDSLLVGGMNRYETAGIMRSTDGGTSWARVRADGGDGQVINAFVETDDGAVIAAGRAGATGSVAAIWSSADGVTWRGTRFPALGSDGAPLSVIVELGDDLFAIKLADDDLRAIAPATGAGNLDGFHWEVIRIDQDAGEAAVTSVVTSDLLLPTLASFDDALWTIGRRTGGTTVLRSGDGMTWDPVPLPAALAAPTVVRVIAGHLFAAGVAGDSVVVASFDAEAWTVTTVTSPEPVRGLYDLAQAPSGAWAAIVETAGGPVVLTARGAGDP